METKKKLRIVRGQFMRGTEVVKPEFGNLEQISLLKTFTTLHELYSGEGMEVEPLFAEIKHIEMDVTFQCVCGFHLTVSGELECDSWGDRYEDPTDFKRSCSCGKKYEGTWDKENDEFVIKYANS